MRTWKEMAQTAKNGVTAGSQTLVEILGTRRVLVEHHRGILAYEREEILVGASFGRIRVLGSDLQLGCMSREQLFVCGRIQQVVLEAREG